MGIQIRSVIVEDETFVLACKRLHDLYKGIKVIGFQSVSDTERMGLALLETPILIKKEKK